MNIQLFMIRMWSELRTNRHKGSWQDFASTANFDVLLGELKHHVAKLEADILNQNIDVLKEHSADTANCALFLWHRAKK